MEYRKDKDRVILRVKRGESPIEALKKTAHDLGIEGGVILGIGAIENPTLSYFDVKSRDYIDKKFTGEYELLSCIGNFSVKEGSIFPHIHVTLGDADFSAIGNALFL